MRVIAIAIVAASVIIAVTALVISSRHKTKACDFWSRDVACQTTRN